MRLIRVLALVCLGLLPVAVQATYVLDECTRSDGYLGKSIFIPVTQNIGRDVQDGEAFGQWFSYTITWTCTRKSVPPPPDPTAYHRPNDWFHVKTWFHPAAVVDKGLFAEDPSFRVYGFAGHNFGFIIKVEQHIEGQAPQTTHLNSLPGVFMPEMEFVGTHARSHGDVSKFHLAWHVRLVKLQGVPYPPVTVNIHGITANFYTSKYHKHANIEWFHHSHYYSYFRTTIKNINAACKLSVPAADVQLGEVSAYTIRDPLQTGPSTGFNINFKDCPAYMGSVSYRFQPLPGQTWPIGVPNNYGVLPQRDTSATGAQGVAVQVLDENDQPIPFDTPIELSAYNPQTPDPNYAVPLKAHIIRTGGDLKAGNVEAAMNVVATYK